MWTYLRRCHFKSLLRRRCFSVDAHEEEIICETFAERCVPKTKEEFKKVTKLEVKQPANAKLNKVAIIGLPNAGKSTLTNQLIGWKVSSVSSKVHTTRKNVIGVYNDGSTQIELLDTPGLVTAEHCSKFNLEPSFLNDPQRSVENADLIAVICDASNKREREKLNYGILRVLYKYRDRPSILVLNKVDAINQKRKLLYVTDVLTGDAFGEQWKVNTRRRTKFDAERLENLFVETERRLENKECLQVHDNIQKPTKDQKSWSHFSRVFYVSALTGDGVEDIRQYFVDTAKPAPWKYPNSLVTDQNPKKLAINVIREKLLDCCVHEVPYNVTLKIESWHVDEVGTLWILVAATCPKSRHMSIVLGPNGSNIIQISALARQELANAFRCDISLKIVVKCSENKKE